MNVDVGIGIKDESMLDDFIFDEFDKESQRLFGTNKGDLYSTLKFDIGKEMFAYVAYFPIFERDDEDGIISVNVDAIEGRLRVSPSPLLLPSEDSVIKYNKFKRCEESDCSDMWCMGYSKIFGSEVSLRFCVKCDYLIVEDLTQSAVFPLSNVSPSDSGDGSSVFNLVLSKSLVSSFLFLFLDQFDDSEFESCMEAGHDVSIYDPIFKSDRCYQHCVNCRKLWIDKHRPNEADYIEYLATPSPLLSLINKNLEKEQELKRNKNE